MQNAGANQNGFTLVELIVSLMLVGIIAAVAGMAMTPFFEGFVDARRNAEMTQKAQIALTRMVKDITTISAVASGTATAVTFTCQHGSTSVTYTYSWSGTAGDPVVLNPATTNDTLIDRVNNFQLVYVYYTTGGVEMTENTWTANSKGIEIQLTLEDATAIVHTARAFPRNLP